MGGVLAGSVEVAYGGAVIEASICSMSDDFNNLKRASGKGDSETELNTGKWNKGSHKSAEDSLKKHFDKHGEEVGAKDPQQYLRKAEEFAKNLKGARKAYNIPGETPNVTRYYKNGKYIDLAPDGTIISFGKQ